jgi:hypothetical protein
MNLVFFQKLHLKYMTRKPKGNMDNNFKRITFLGKKVFLSSYTSNPFQYSTLPNH